MQKILDDILPFVTRPGRYIGNEINVIKKDSSQVEVRFALAFPDLYEIGMSHLGMGILYHVLNRESWIAAERVFAPWLDMEEKMRSHDIPLYTLETFSPVREMDVLGFSLQYELQYTNVLNMIDLAGLPLLRSSRKDGHPLIIAGGPCAFHAEPMTDFLDAVVLGDGEKVVIEITTVVREAKKQHLPRVEILDKLSRLQGVYVPSLYGSEDQHIVPQNDSAPLTVSANVLERLSEEDYPEKPLVPLIEITHDRLSLEVMRGCLRGCRFCNAGMIYRPERYRKAEDLFRYCRKAISHTGFDEISLVSLSTSDYPCLTDLLGKLRGWAGSRRISVSFPSLRAETFTEEIALMAQEMKRSGLTLAPEAGSQRLRDIINKNNREEDLLESVERAFRLGWKRVKLYFMIGLPQERDEDLEALIELVTKAAALGKKYGRREIHVAVSPFSPKPHTPFQWEAQDTQEELQRKVHYLKLNLRGGGITLSWRNPEVSRLETALGRGGREVSRVILSSWKKGARFDSWSDHFNPDLWYQSFEEEGISMTGLCETIPVQTRLPWDHLEKGVTKEYLLKERALALQGQTSDSCRQGRCQDCGLRNSPACKTMLKEAGKSSRKGRAKQEHGTAARKPNRTMDLDGSRMVRIAYQKQKSVRFTSHLDTIRIFTRALYRANISMVMSQGFRPHPQLSSGPPLPLGFVSRAEYMDIMLEGPVPENFLEKLNGQLPDGFHVYDFCWIDKKTPSLNSAVNRFEYKIYHSELSNLDTLQDSIDSFLQKNSVVIQREKGNRHVEVDIRLYVIDLTLEDGCLNLYTRTGNNGTVRVREVLNEIFPHRRITETAFVERTAQQIEKHERKITPLQIK